MNHTAYVRPYVVLALLALLMIPAHAGAFVLFDFEFGNHIDTHQDTYLIVKNGEPRYLRGNFYIIFAGDFDPESGLPVARHPRGAAHNEECGVDLTCDVG